MRSFTKFSLIIIIGVIISVILFNIKKNIVEISPSVKSETTATSSPNQTFLTTSKNTDIEPQKPLADPPKNIKALYATSWSAATESRINDLINLIKTTELNAIVIDIKDFSGYIAYDIKLSDAEKYRAKDIRIKNINYLIKKLHDNGIYAIARITVFQDPVLAKARPDLAIKSKKTGQIWKDKKGLSWIDPASKDAWNYDIAIAEDAASRGFDEINFDYIRFASDGNLDDMEFPNWDGKIPKSEIIKNFFQYLREQLPDIKISADLFGLATIDNGDLGIGQVIENAYKYFDYVCPMVYPSHYAKGILNYKNPAEHPYEVIKYSIENAVFKYRRLARSYSATTTIIQKNQNPENDPLSVKLRPWLQDFNLGAIYDANMVRKEIQGVYDGASSSPELINGFMLWSPSNIYTKGALKSE